MTLSNAKSSGLPGKPDTDFGNDNGMAYLQDLLGRDPAFEVLALFRGIYSDLQGKTVFSAEVFHEDRYKYVLGRINADGTGDPTFADNGLRLGSFAHPASCGGGKLTVQENGAGHIYLQGWTENLTGWSDLAIACFDQHGQPQTSFGDNGNLIIETPSDQELMTDSCAVHVRSDGKLLISFNYMQRNGSLITTGVVLRLLPNGQPDTSFNGSGRWQFTLADPLASTAINGCLSQGKSIVLAGYVRSTPGDNRAFFARLEDNGQIDTTFGDPRSPGFHYIDLTDKSTLFNAVIERPDGTLIAAGAAASKSDTSVAGLMVAMTPQGSPHLMFNQGKPLLTQFDEGRDNDWSSALAQTDNKIVLTTSKWWALVARFNPDASLDTAFNGTGYTEADFTVPNPPVQLISRQDGRVIVSANITGIKPDGLGIMKCFFS